MAKTENEQFGNEIVSDSPESYPKAFAALLSVDFTPTTDTGPASGEVLAPTEIGHSVSDTQIAAFRALVLEYYRDHGRDLPWRRTTDPYAIFVAEVMLQQTQAPRVIPKYEQFLRLFPDFRTLADAHLRDVLAAWSGLGYNRRARYLRDAAAVVCDEFGGVLPRDPALLGTLSGIGRATACSIAAFAFDRPVVFLETNIRRVHLHFFFRGMAGIADPDLLPLVGRPLYRPSPRDWYNGLMDVGTLLKQQLPNPNRRSRHHKHQAPFENSNRQIRGGIIRLLTAEEGIPADRLATRLKRDPQRVAAAAEELVAEGFLYYREGAYYVGE